MSDVKPGHEEATLDFPGRRKELLAGYRDLHRRIPDSMKAFAGLHRAAMEDGELSRATKELMALAIGIHTGCDGCVAFHVHDALRAGATKGQVEEAIGVAMMMGGGPASIHAADALVALDQFLDPGAGR